MSDTTTPAAIRLRKIPARFSGIVLSLILSVLMSGVVSLTVTMRTASFTPALLWQWTSAWGASWLVAFPTLLLVAPLARRLAAMIVERPA